jgi:hypothetical protein
VKLKIVGDVVVGVVSVVEVVVSVIILFLSFNAHKGRVSLASDFTPARLSSLGKCIRSTKLNLPPKPG